jgi:hypothetical protein
MNVPAVDVSVLWRIHGAVKDIECTLAPHPAGLELRIERGDERELFWRTVVLSRREALNVSTTVRERLLTSGWSLIDAEGEHSLRVQVTRAAALPAA